MSENPTLRHGDEGADGWVEYLQTLLRVHAFTGTPQFGVFDDVTDRLHTFRIWRATGAGPAGRYGMVMQLPMETGGDTLQVEFDRPAN